jgi:hypothetical protein
MKNDRCSDPLAIYQIRIKGQLDNRWSDWFDGLTIASQVDGDTVMRGVVVDQAALFGLLNKIRDMGLTLLSVNKTSNDEGSED